MRGGRRHDRREVIGAIARRFRTGTQWMRLLEKYGNWQGVRNRLRMRAVYGTWERVFTVPRSVVPHPYRRSGGGDEREGCS